MTSYLQSLMNQDAPLEPHELQDLRNWLNVLESDCNVYGESAEDTHRMNRIRKRIQAEENKG